MNRQLTEHSLTEGLAVDWLVGDLAHVGHILLDAALLALARASRNCWRSSGVAVAASLTALAFARCSAFTDGVSDGTARASRFVVRRRRRQQRYRATCVQEFCDRSCVIH